MICTDHAVSRVIAAQPNSAAARLGVKWRRSAQAAGSRTPSAEVVEPVDPLRRDVLSDVEDSQGAGQKWAAPADGFGFEQPDRRLGRALAYASPMHPIDAAISSSTRASANAIKSGRASHNQPA